jgi:hypothetical protein
MFTIGSWTISLHTNSCTLNMVNSKFYQKWTHLPFKFEKNTHKSGIIKITVWREQSESWLDILPRIKQTTKYSKTISLWLTHVLLLFYKTTASKEIWLQSSSGDKHWEPKTLSLDIQEYLYHYHYHYYAFSEVARIECMMGRLCLSDNSHISLKLLKRLRLNLAMAVYEYNECCWVNLIWSALV